MSAQFAFVALMVTIKGLWARRSTWQYKWEKASTFNLATLTICIFCVVPQTAPLFDYIDELTGVWNLEDLVGHFAYLCGITTLAYVTIKRVELPNPRRWRLLRLELPATVVLPTLVGMFVAGTPDHQVPDLAIEESHGWLACYWVLSCVVWAWVLGHMLWALLILRTDPESAPVANIYAGAVVVDIAAATSKAVSTLVPAWPLPLFWFLGSIATVGYAAAALRGMHGINRRLSWAPPRTGPEVYG